jgi:hypothetical protein
MLVSLTVGKVDAGVAVLLTEDKRLVRETDDPLHQLLEKTRSFSKSSTLLPRGTSIAIND